MTARLLCTALLLTVPGADEAPAAKYPHADLLIEAPALAKLVSAKKAQLLDARPKGKYGEVHILSAIWVDSAAWSKAFGSAPDRDQWAKRLGALGLQVEKPTVVYGEDLRETARVWWILRYWGFKDVRLLNGGWDAWIVKENPAMSRGAPPIEPTMPALKAHPERLATKDQVLGYVKGKDHLIIDARSRKEYCGDQKLAKRGGSIPGAKNLEWSDLLDKEGRFKSAADLAGLFKEHDINPKQPAVTYCQSGGRASVMAFALELMGAKDVRNYYRSWNEWGNDPQTPIVMPIGK